MSKKSPTYNPATSERRKNESNKSKNKKSLKDPFIGISIFDYKYGGRKKYKKRII